ncbi:hypothetical protein [Leptolyngbya sp. Cla-17]|uniref:hypothetical protein n=1 Tax=Leptolyngbya sp. Cla-17 TaxID=2803751 RepID=UPI0018D8B344|nr:hypothetical protein [Leptolyngbya sp. Cla-17]
MEIFTELQAMSQTAEVEDWAPPMPLTDLIFDDGALESNRHRIAIKQRAEGLAERLREVGIDPGQV